MLFKRKKKELWNVKQMDASTLMLIEAAKVMPARELTRVISSVLRDRRDILPADMRILAHELDRDADRRDRVGLY